MRAPAPKMSFLGSTSQQRPERVPAANGITSTNSNSGTTTPRSSSLQTEVSTSEAAAKGGGGAPAAAGPAGFDWGNPNTTDDDVDGQGGKDRGQRQDQSNPFTARFQNASSSLSSSARSPIYQTQSTPSARSTANGSDYFVKRNNYNSTNQPSPPPPPSPSMHISLPHPAKRSGGGGTAQSSHYIPPTPGPSSHGKDHPWAKLFAGGSGSSCSGSNNNNNNNHIPTTPAASAVTAPTTNLSLPFAQRRDSQLSQRSRKPSLLAGNDGITASQEGHQSRYVPSSSTGSSTMAASPSCDPNSFAAQPSKSHYTGPSAASWPVALKAQKPSLEEDESKYRAIDGSTLAKMMSSGNGQHPSAADRGSSLLILDIRPSTAFRNSRIAGSINVCAPSTLLRRPGVTIDRIEAEMLQSDTDRFRFTRWKKGPMRAGGDDERRPSAASTPCSPDGIQRIVVLDTDTSHTGTIGRPAVGGGGPCLLGMLKKFDAAGYAGELYWLVGGYAGFSAFVAQKMPEQQGMVEDGPLDLENQAQQGVAPMEVESPVDSSSSSGMKSPVAKLKLSDLPQQRHASEPHDFSPSSQLPPNLNDRSGSHRSLVQCGALPLDAFTDKTTTVAAAGRRRHNSMLLSASDSNLFGLPGKSPSGSRSSAACNPFFDNIRQNRELQHGITDRIPLDLRFLTQTQKQDELPTFLRDIAVKDEQAVTDQLAQDFFDIEKAEQTRLMATMRQHAAESTMDPRQRNEVLQSGTNESDADAEGSTADNHKGSPPAQLTSSYSRVDGLPLASSPSTSSFPFSIAAAIERGGENRYNNIWTYEHSRVQVSTAGTHLGESGPGGTVSQYLNASFVQPLREFGSHRKYIATQAPLPSTFETFWNAVWQQNCRTIAMLTREYESGRVQSHNYWSEESYGSTVKLRIIEEVELNGKGETCTATSKKENPDDSTSAGFFHSSDSAQANNPNEAVMIRRKLLLSLVGSAEEPKEITQFQYIGWPDYSIPVDPEAILVFMDLVNEAQHDAHRALAGQGVADLGRFDETKTSATGPLLLHCSAGVGRTGTYIVIDSVLDVLRQERRRSVGLQPLALWDNGLRSQSGSDQDDYIDVDMTPAINSTAKFAFNPLASPMGRKNPLLTNDRASRSMAVTPSDTLTTSGGGTDRAPGMHVFPQQLDDGLLSPKSSRSNFHLLPQRERSIRSLKRELSPSADMEIDQRPGPPASTGTENGNYDSAPASAISSPLGPQSGDNGGVSFSRTGGSLRRETRAKGFRRQRSDTSDDTSVITTDAEPDRPSSLEDRESPLPPAMMRTGSGSGGASARSSFSFQTRSGRLGSLGGGGAPEEQQGGHPTTTGTGTWANAAGMDTPSRAMDGMNLGLPSSGPSSHTGTPPPPLIFGAGGSAAFGGGAGGTTTAGHHAPTPSSFKLSLPFHPNPASNLQASQQAQTQNTATNQDPPRRFSIARTTHSSASEARSSPNPPIPIPSPHTSGSGAVVVGQPGQRAADARRGSSTTTEGLDAKGASASSSSPSSTSASASASASASYPSSSSTSPTVPTSIGGSAGASIGRTAAAAASAAPAAGVVVGGGGVSHHHDDPPDDDASNPLGPGPSHLASASEQDLIRHATHVAREQRMSSVQTQRQYVFCYLAVIKGVLREALRERDREREKIDG